MKEKRSPVQVYYLFKSFVIMFMIQAVIVFFTPLGLTAAIWYQILAVNLIVGVVLGWFLYRQWYHIEFSYDEDGFQLRKGKTPSVNANWSEFYRVSLARNEYGEFSVRLYRNGDWLEIPASKLKINPFHFRLQAMEFTQKAMALSK